jgi:hypothetical protein
MAFIYYFFSSYFFSSMKIYFFFLKAADWGPVGMVMDLLLLILATTSAGLTTSAGFLSIFYGYFFY